MPAAQRASLKGERGSRQKPGQAAQARQPRVEAHEETGIADFFERRPMLFVFGIVDETTEMNAIMLREESQDIPGSDFVALVGWIGNPMSEKQKLPHGFNPDYERYAVRSDWPPPGANVSRRR